MTGHMTGKCVPDTLPVHSTWEEMSNDTVDRRQIVSYGTTREPNATVLWYILAKQLC